MTEACKIIPQLTLFMRIFITRTLHALPERKTACMYALISYYYQHVTKKSDFVCTTLHW
jgi:hypothetical protein